MLTSSTATKSKSQNDVVNSDKIGFYVFGGMNQKKEPTNDLYFVKPCYKENNDLYDMKSENFFPEVEPRIYFEIKKIIAKGTPPSER